MAENSRSAAQRRGDGAPMDERTKATVRALLDRYPRGYLAEEAGFAATGTAAGLFRLLCVALLADDTVPSGSALEAVRALLRRGWGSAPEMAKTSDRDRAEAISGARYGPAEQASRQLGEATRFLLDRYDGDLGRLREAAGGEPGRLRRLLWEVPGMTEPGLAVFLREAQMFWPEAGPFLDEHAARAARRLGLPDDPGDLLRDVARGSGAETLSWLAGALAVVDAHDEYGQVRARAHA